MSYVLRGFHISRICEASLQNEYPEALFSMTKTFASLAIGIAGDLGLLTIDDYIIKYFPEDLPQLPDKNLCRIKIHHLLTMSSGIHDNTYAGLYAQSNWIKAFLKQEFPHDRGSITATARTAPICCQLS